MKYFIPPFVLIALMTPLVASATPTSWDFAAGILQPLQSQWTALIKGDHFQATSTSATSIFPLASTTVTSATTLCLSADCRTMWPTTSATGLATTSPWIVSNLAYVVDNGHVSSVATSTLSASSPLTGSFTQIGSGGSLGIQVANTSQNGYLSSTDWNTFNGKQAAGNYITALTGDVTASGPGSVAATLATVNSNVGSFTCTSFTVNGKGLITAASSGTCGSGTVGSGTTGQMPYYAANGTTLTATSTLFLDTTSRIGVGSTTPGSLLSVAGSAGGTIPLFAISSSTVAFATSTPFQIDVNGNVLVQGTTIQIGKATAVATTSASAITISSGVNNPVTYYNTLDQSTNFEKVTTGWSGSNVFNGFVLTAAGGGTVNRQINIAVAGGATLAVTTGGQLTLARGGTTAGPVAAFPAAGTAAYTASSGNQIMLGVQPSFSQTSTAGYTGLLIQPTETTIGSGLSFLTKMGTSTMPQLFSVSNLGIINLATTTTGSYAGCTALNTNSNGVVGCTNSTLGTVTSIATNNGITGGTITTTGTIGLAAIAANSVLGNITGASAVPVAVATSSLFLNASAASTGLLTSTDWSTFNSKVSSQWTGTSPASIYYSANNVGIGTTSPYAALSVSTTTQDSATATLFAVGSTTNASLMAVLGNGNVGIGTTSPFTQFAVSSAAPIIAMKDTTAGGNTFMLRNGSTGIGNFPVTGDFDIYNAKNKTSMIYIQNAPGMGAGQVMVGTSTNGAPSNGSRLFVFGGANGANIDTQGDPNQSGGLGDTTSIEAEGSDYNVNGGGVSSISMRYYGPANPSGTTLGYAQQRLGVLDFAAASTSIITTGNNQNGAASNLILGTGYTQKAVLTGTGLFGIGTTSPYATLSINGTSTQATPLFAVASSSAAATTTVFSIDSTGNVTSLADVTINDSNRANGGVALSASTTWNGSGAAQGRIGVSGTAYNNSNTASARTKAAVFVNSFGGAVNNVVTNAALNPGGAAGAVFGSQNNSNGFNLANQVAFSAVTQMNQFGNDYASTTNAIDVAMQAPSGNGANALITNFYGAKVLNTTPSFTVQNTTGLNIEGSTYGTVSNVGILSGTTANPAGNYFIYESDATKNYFNGLTGIGTTTPAFALSVSTSTQQLGTIPLFTIASTTNATLLTVLGNGLIGIGTTTPVSKLTVNGDIGTDGTNVTVSSCGTGAAVTVGSTDTAGEITEGTLATGCTISFSSTKASAPFCVLDSQSGLAFTNSESTTAITVVNIGALSSTKIDYVCIGNSK